MNTTFFLIGWLLSLCMTVPYMYYRYKTTKQFDYFLTFVGFIPLLSTLTAIFIVMMTTYKLSIEEKYENTVVECPSCGEFARRYQVSQDGRMKCCIGTGRYHRTDQTPDINIPTIDKAQLFKNKLNLL